MDVHPPKYGIIGFDPLPYEGYTGCMIFLEILRHFAGLSSTRRRRLLFVLKRAVEAGTFINIPEVTPFTENPSISVGFPQINPG